MTKREFVEYVNAIKDGAGGRDDLIGALKAEGFDQLGEGVEKIAFARPGDKYVVKVRKYPSERGPYNALAEVRAYGARNTKNYIPMVYADGRIQIQRRVVPCTAQKGFSRDSWECASAFPDGHSGNHTHTAKGGVKLFDYD